MSLTILAIVATVAAATLLSVLGTTTNDRERVAAANLATRELEFVRAQFESPTVGPQSVDLGQVVNQVPLPGGTKGNPLVVDNHSFTVTRTSEWQTQGATSGPCDGGASGQLAYLRVSVLVSWPNMGKTTPVTAATLLAPGLGTYNAGSGHIKAKVIDGVGNPEAGTTMTVRNSGGGVIDSQSTAADGCAFFAFLDPGNYTVTASRAGYVDQTWAPSTSTSVTVVANVAAPASFAYAEASTTVFTFDTSQAGYSPAAATALTVYNPAITGSATYTKSFSSSAPTRTLTTWPYSTGLIAWSGDCTDADPAASGGSRPNPTVTDPGTNVSSVLKGAAVGVVVKKATGTPVSGATVEAVHSTAGCPSTMRDPADGSTVGEVLTLPVTTDSTGTSKVLLPYGTWTLKVISQTASTTWPVVNLQGSATFPAPYAVTVR